MKEINQMSVWFICVYIGKAEGDNVLHICIGKAEGDNVLHLASVLDAIGHMRLNYCHFVCRGTFARHVSIYIRQKKIHTMFFMSLLNCQFILWRNCCHLIHK